MSENLDKLNASIALIIPLLKSIEKDLIKEAISLSGWQRVRTRSITLAKELKVFRKLSMKVKVEIKAERKKGYNETNKLKYKLRRLGNENIKS